MRASLGQPAAAVHPVGGIADEATRDDYLGFLRAARDAGAIGVSVYDAVTTPDSGWDILGEAAAF